MTILDPLSAGLMTMCGLFLSVCSDSRSVVVRLSCLSVCVL